jgi:hypothetical protein
MDLWDILVVNPIQYGTPMSELVMPFDYDHSFRADREADKDPEDALEPTARDIILASLTDKLLELTLANRDDCETMAEQLLSRIEPYICYEGKQ